LQNVTIGKFVLNLVHLNVLHFYINLTQVVKK